VLLRSRGIDSRPFFHPLDTLPPYRAAQRCGHVAQRLSAAGLNLPSFPSLTDSQVVYIVAETIGRPGAGVTRLSRGPRFGVRAAHVHFSLDWTMFTVHAGNAHQASL
jgi:hypothetical protein